MHRESVCISVRTRLTVLLVSQLSCPRRRTEVPLDNMEVVDSWSIGFGDCMALFSNLRSEERERYDELSVSRESRKEDRPLGYPCLDALFLLNGYDLLAPSPLD